MMHITGVEIFLAHMSKMKETIKRRSDYDSEKILGRSTSIKTLPLESLKDQKQEKVHSRKVLRNSRYHSK